MSGLGSLQALQTPALVLSETRLERNISAMKARMDALGVRLRPHIKTAKSAPVFSRAMQGAVGATVSTLAEAEYAFSSGITNILYAVGMAPGKLVRALAIIDAGADLTLTVDSIDAAKMISETCAAAGAIVPVVVEIDCDDHRAGVKPSSEDAAVIARWLADNAGVRFRGVMTHAGGSYDCRTVDEIRAVAERERRAVVGTAQMLAKQGITCEIVSVGSTPTATFGRSFEGVTEVRAGVYMFQDLVMAGLGVCGLDDIAITVLTAVIGHQREKNWLLVDAGWMALSGDRGTSKHTVDQGYGLVCNVSGEPYDDLIVIGANQEHGIVARRDGAELNIELFPIGTLLRIMPNHACATAAQFDQYHVIRDEQSIEAVWPRINRW